jgi:hypothetical protein
MAGGSLKNLVVAFLVPLPSILFYLSFVRHGGDADAGPLPSWCAEHPLLLANILFFLNVNVLFWLVGVLLSNHWVRTSRFLGFMTPPLFRFTVSPALCSAKC